ncbi:hypothetical protein CCHL11_01516 [Colletotrichum chlorophyti]|uniref:Uncharacterized protein n=1 Tax=Colletotrichum chlorophyti TaxID=708187 RepID=A0A1Q8RXU4_9PEZI|nr:hypothetical protein CCHL11_01516 [Colletotrichum chlorophyti]
MEDLDALRKEATVTDQQVCESAEGFASILLQVFDEMLQERDRRMVTHVPPTSTAPDGLVNDRLDALEKQHQEETTKQELQIELLRKGLSTETAQRKALGIEIESLGKRMRELETQNQAMKSSVDAYGKSIERLETETPGDGVVPALATQTPPTLQGNSVKAEDLAEVKTVVEECLSRVTELVTTVQAHDEKLGEMDTDILNETCDAIVAKLPRLEQTLKRAADDITTLRSDLRAQDMGTKSLQTGAERLHTDLQQLRSDTEKLQSHTEQLRTDADQLLTTGEQLKTYTGQLQSRTELLQSEQEHLKTDTQQLKSETRQLQSKVEQSRLDEQRRTDEKFITVKAFKDMNKHVFETFSGWIEGVRQRVSAVEGEVSTLQGKNDQVRNHDLRIMANEVQAGSRPVSTGQSQNHNPPNGQVSNQVVDLLTIQLEEKLKDYDARLKVLEAVSRSGEQSTHNNTYEESANVVAALAQKRASADSIESMKIAIEALKAQLAMIDSSIKAVCESAKLVNESQTAQGRRIAELESAYAHPWDERVERMLERKLDSMQQKLEFIQHGYTSLDSQINSLTTESLFQSILQHVNKYEPMDALIGSKVETAMQQMNTYEQRLGALERTVSSVDEPAHKKRKLVPFVQAVTNGKH